MAVPDYQTLMLPVLRLFAAGKSSVRDCLPDLKREFEIDDGEATELLPSGRVTILASRAHWARTYLSKAGLFSSPKRNHHQITAAGRDLLAAEPARIDVKSLAANEDFERWRRGGPRKDGEQSASVSPDEILPSPETPLEQINSAIDAINRDVESDLMQLLLDCSPSFFEKVVIDVLVAMGYGRGREGAGRLTGRSNDDGVDGVIDEDPLGLDVVYIQAKRYAPDNIVGRPAIQQFVGSMTGEGASKGVFVTTSSFSKGAVDYTKRIAQRVILIDGDRLARLMAVNEVGVRAARTVIIPEIDENYFPEE